MLGFPLAQEWGRRCVQWAHTRHCSTPALALHCPWYVSTWAAGSILHPLHHCSVPHPLPTPVQVSRLMSHGADLFQSVPLFRDRPGRGTVVDHAHQQLTRVGAGQGT